MDKYSVFLSYSRKDDLGLDSISIVRKVYHLLSNESDNGQSSRRVFFDRLEMPSREPSFTSAIAQAISSCDHFILFVGDHFDKSEYVEAELRHAQRSGCVIYPVLYQTQLPDSEAFGLIPGYLSAKHAFDLRHPDTPRFQEELSRLSREVHSPIPPKGPLFGAPPYDVNKYVLRENPCDSVYSALFGYSHTDIETCRIVAVCGMAGSGKSTLVSYLARDASVRRHFQDGVIWLNVTRNGKPEGLWRQLSSFFSDLQRDVIEDEIELHLKNAFFDRRCLFVLDDIWDSSSLTLFHNALWETESCILVTTRDSSFLSSKASHVVSLDTMDCDDAADLLSRYSGCRPNELPRAAYELCEKLGRLPLALAIAGSMARDGRSWELISEEYDRKRKEFLSRRIDGYSCEGHESAYVAIKMSVDALDASLSPYYLKLAVFPKSEDIPITAIETLWGKQVNSYETESIIHDLQSKALLSFNKDEKTVRLHDIHCDFLLLLLKNIAGLHEEFLEAYRAKTHGNWWDGPDDGYYYSHIIQHLVAASSKHHQEAMACICDYRWINNKLKACGIAALKNDYSLVTAEYSSGARQIGEFLDISAHVLADAPEQLPAQICGRLLPATKGVIGQLIEDAHLYGKKPWLCPNTQCMLPLNTGLISAINTGEWIMTFTIFEDKLITCDWAGRVREWDLETKECTRIAQGETKILCSVLNESTLITADEARHLRWWDIESFSITIERNLNGIPLCMRKGASLYILGDQNAIEEYSLAGESIASIQLPHGITSFEVLPEGLLLFSNQGSVFWLGFDSTLEEIMALGSAIITTYLCNEDVWIGCEDGSVHVLSTNSLESSIANECSEPPRVFCSWKDGMVTGGALGGLWHSDSSGEDKKIFDIGARVDAVIERGSKLITGDSAGRICLWDDRLMQAQDHDYRLRDIKRCIIHNGTVVLATRAGKIVTYDPVNLEINRLLYDGPGEIAALATIKEDLCFAYDDGCIYRLKSGEPTLFLRCPELNIRSLGWYAGFVYVVDKSGSLHRFNDTSEGELVYDHSALITAVQPGFDRLLVADDFGQIRIEDENRIASKTLNEDIWIRALAVDDSRIVSGNWFGKVRVYNRITGRCLYVYNADNAIDSVSILGDMVFVVTKGGVLHSLTIEH